MTQTQIRIVKSLQDGLPISQEPFAEAARQVGISVEDLLEQLKQWQSDGAIRRFGAILRHHRAGYDANAMGVWDVPDDQVDGFAAVAVGFGNVSHCYQRPRFAGFRYNLYTMIHGKSKEDCEATAREISEKSGIHDYELLYTTAEFKKSSPVYFTDDETNER